MYYIKRLRDWIKEGKYLYFFIIIFLFTFQMDKFTLGRYETVDNIRFYGLLLQLIGTASIVYSLKEKLLILKGHGLSKFFMEYFRNFPLRQNKKDCRLEGNAITITPIIGRPRLIINPKEDLKEVIEYFQKEIEQIHNTLEQFDDNLRKEVNDLKVNIANVKNVLNKEITETKLLIKETNVSNVWLDTFGLACIIWGLILGTAPDLIEILL